MTPFAIILLALAVSIDGLGVGLACGLARVKLSPLSLVLMGLASGTAVLLSMTAGSLVGRLMDPAITARLGGLLLVVFGGWMLWQSRTANTKDGLMGLLEEPSRADADSSGTISAKEAILLGVALALDAFGAGFGAALAGFSPLATGASVAAAKVILVGGGLALGNLASSHSWVKHLKILPGLIISVLGILKIFLL